MQLHHFGSYFLHLQRLFLLEPFVDDCRDDVEQSERRMVKFDSESKFSSNLRMNTTHSHTVLGLQELNILLHLNGFSNELLLAVHELDKFLFVLEEAEIVDVLFRGYVQNYLGR